MTEVQRMPDGLRLAGVVDVRSVGDVRAALESIVQATGDATRAELRLDMSRVAAVDAAALALLVATHRRVAATGGRLVLDQVGPSLARLLAVTRVNRVLDVRRSPSAHRASPAA
jgi:anti-anti-sigma factor